MKSYLKILKENPLFKGIGEDKLSGTLTDLKAYMAHYEKNQTIREYDREVTEMGIVVRGTAHVVRLDINGNRHILRNIPVGAIFGESLAFSGLNKSPISVVAASECSIVFIPVKDLFHNIISRCENYTKFIENLITMLAIKGILLQIKNEILSKSSIREKLMTYFTYKSDEAGSNAFKIPFTREELADYLSVNRSALTRELSKMQQEGILTYEKKFFTLKTKLPDNRYS